MFCDTKPRVSMCWSELPCMWRSILCVLACGPIYRPSCISWICLGSEAYVLPFVSRLTSTEQVYIKSHQFAEEMPQNIRKWCGNDIDLCMSWTTTVWAVRGSWHRTHVVSRSTIVIMTTWSWHDTSTPLHTRRRQVKCMCPQWGNWLCSNSKHKIKTRVL